MSVTLEVPRSSTSDVPPPAHSGPLPFTGFEVEWLLLAALGLILAGFLVLTILRSRLEPSHA